MRVPLNISVLPLWVRVVSVLIEEPTQLRGSRRERGLDNGSMRSFDVCTFPSEVVMDPVQDSLVGLTHWKVTEVLMVRMWINIELHYQIARIVYLSTAAYDRCMYSCPHRRSRNLGLVSAACDEH